MRHRFVVVFAVLSVCFATLTLVPATAAATTRTVDAGITHYFPSSLFAGQTMGNGEDRTILQLESPLGYFQLNADGNQLAISQNVPPTVGAKYGFGFGPVWSVRSALPANDQRSFLAVQTDGNVVLYSSQGRALWATDTVGSGTHNHLQLQDDGNLVLRTDTNKVVWATYSTRACLGPNDTLKAGQRMVAFELDNPAHFHTLAMQGDGNLVLRDGARVLWASNTRVPGSYVVLQSDGNLVLRAPTGAALWASYTQRFGPSVFLVSYTFATVNDLELPPGGLSIPWYLWGR